MPGINWPLNLYYELADSPWPKPYSSERFMFTVHRQEIILNGKPFALETGKIARQALGSVMVEYGDTRVLCAVTASPDPLPYGDFFPLSVHYQEKSFAAGRIPGGFFKRENKPSDREVLASRLIDRALRPLFVKNFHHEIQVVCTVLSLDEHADPIIAAMVGASAAVSISGLPFKGPAASIRVGYDGHSFMLNPVKLDTSQLDLVIAGTRDGIIMVESEVKELTEDTMLKALAYGHKELNPLIDLIDALTRQAAKPHFAYDNYNERKEAIWTDIEPAAGWQGICAIADVQERAKALEQLKGEIYTQMEAKGYDMDLVRLVFHGTWKHHARHHILSQKKRLDGRGYETIRPINCEVSILPRVHGSALFTRGSTQALVTATLGGADDAQLVDNLTGSYRDTFMLHYNFPSYCVGEVGRVGAPGRRELGHGKLAWRALQAVLPEKLPYTVRLVSDITESNGSSSMATVCGGSLALMDAGVTIKRPVAGIAMGLIHEGKGIALLSDISGIEDELGDMDFKVAGTSEGITALQMDLKGLPLPHELIAQIIEQAKRGRLHILETMNTQALSQARTELSPHAPIMATLRISPDKIRDLIGPGGKVIRELCASTGSKIDIADDGTVSIFSPNEEASCQTQSRIQQLIGIPNIGETYWGTVVKLLEFGAFVNFGFPQDGMVHISEIAPERIEDITSVLSVGDKVRVKFLGFDARGRTKLSIRQAQPPAKQAEA